MKQFLFLIFVVSTLTACHTLNNKKTMPRPQATSAYTHGINMANSFGANNALRAPFNQVYHFDFAKDVIHQNDLPSIQVQANYLVAHRHARVRLEGNTDERGSREYNVALGWRRAKAVAEILKEEGVMPKQIKMISYGEEKPVALGHDEAAYRQNRRVNLIYEVK